MLSRPPGRFSIDSSTVATGVRTAYVEICASYFLMGWLGSRVVSVLDSGAEGFKSQSRRCRLTVLGKLFTPIVPLFIKQRN